MKQHWIKHLLYACIGLPILALGFAMYANTTQSVQADANKFVSVGVSKDGQTYYVDSKNGDDTADGTSPKTAWKTLSRVNQQTFKAGDHILLNADSTWNNEYLWPKGDGTEQAPIAIDLYQVGTDGKAVYSANQRPVINGNGTYSVGSSKRAVSGTIQLRNQENWDISNIEVTNSPDTSDKELYKKPGDAQRAGILVYGDTQDHTFNNIRIRNNYVHDVQSEYYLNYGGDRTTQRSKAVGGIIVYGAWFNQDGDEVIPANEHRSSTGFNNVLIEHNAVVRVGLEGIRTKADADTSRGNNFFKTFTNIKIKNNYLQDIAGDGVVLSEVAAGGLVEGNVVNRPCNADYGKQNYAGLWAMSTDHAIFQYNEVYGIRYGYNDAEAFDIDMACDGVIYQYNYSHDNAGGFMLTMGDQKNSIIRYNISANDGFGNSGTSADNPGKSSAYEYSEQSLMHYWQKTDNSTMPQVYNNTLYVGDGISTSLFGEGNSSNNSGVTSHFENNILYKEGSGSLKFLSNFPDNGDPAVENTLGANVDQFFKHNVIFPESVASERSGATPDVLKAGGNVLADPSLAISKDPALQAELKAQSDTVFDPASDDIAAFTDTAKLRERTAMFKPADDSPAVGLGLTKSATEDFFGTSLKNKVPDAGFSQISNVTKTTKYHDVSLEITSLTGFYPKLPTELKIDYDELVNDQITSSGQATSPVQWDVIPTEDVLKPGTVTVKGHATNLENNDFSITATVTFTGDLGTGIGNAQYPASEVAYVQKSIADKAYSSAAAGVSTIPENDAYKYPFGVNYTGNASVKLKNAKSDGYNRRIYVTVPADKLTDGVKQALLRLTIMRYDSWVSAAGVTNAEKLANTQYHIQAYAVDPTWESTKITWSNAPDNDTDKTPIATRDVTNKEVIANHNQLDIDVSNYFSQLSAQGALPDKVSFMIAITDSSLPNYDRDNAGFDAFTTTGALQAYKDYQAGTLTVPDGIKMSETALAPQLVVNNVYEQGYAPINISTQAGEAPELPATVTVNYSDKTTKEVPVSWPEITPDQYAEAGTFDLVGQADGVALPIVAHITVKAPRTVVSFEALAPIDRFVGKSRNDLDLPSTVKANISDGTQVEYKILSWDDDPSNYTESSPAGTYHFPASVADIPGITIPDGQKPSQTVNTHVVPETLQFTESVVSLKPGETYQTVLQAFDKNGTEITDSWSKAATYSAATKDPAAEVPVSIDKDGLVTVSDTAASQSYEITATSSQIKDLTATLTVKVDSSVDKTALNKLILQANGLKAKDYTVESWANFVDALTAANKVAADSEATQTSVDAATKTLDDAIKALVKAPVTPNVDKTKLNKLILQANGLKAKDYTVESWAKFVDALTAANKVAADPEATQTSVDAATKTLDDAIKALVKAPVTPNVDKTKLNKLILQANGLKAKDYTVESWAKFVDALTAANKVAADPEATQTSVDTATKTLDDAIKALVKAPVTSNVDKTKLNKLIIHANGLEAKDYTVESWTHFIDALIAANKVAADSGATQTTVDAATKTLGNAIESLVKTTVTPNVDKTKLNKLIVLANGLKAKDYTVESWAKFVDALTAANKVAADSKATQVTVDAAAKTLDDAIKALVKAPVTPAVDKTALNNLIAQSNGLKAEDYTAESWAKFIDALNAANKVAADPEATQETVDTVANFLKATLDSLVPNSQTPQGETELPTENGSNTSPKDQSGHETGSTQNKLPETGEDQALLTSLSGLLMLGALLELGAIGKKFNRQ
ncbi:Ig-like domain-containing protein [Lacticaseibacillus hegangensis]|uniref:Ig-like domain-containing protein n=1 Tax=Lacticaseibacillus hegangensis TaxID=2486010 RepID=A0ABW4CTU8_9LACO|nr:Ig-like domain-containing protein [Lacticaseibacillus hegangensis]